ncbi:hypothetical protein I7I50_06889 [Histoplasma capsulatum G186AR]|uniref:Uncharacterized protein n=1 Tax=Ajellomyces capsulatus TaxID=5037 RepID=A0A8H7Z0M6_AJECA|nr:hypothetical protein I7I52_10037 [Histoplasma capsulatum]QSS67722.1 hypothetical protein I7I50_06889 [Histoplasma capsulatum G186AR]
MRFYLLHARPDSAGPIDILLMPITSVWFPPFQPGCVHILNGFALPLNAPRCSTEKERRQITLNTGPMMAFGFPIRLVRWDGN